MTAPVREVKVKPGDAAASRGEGEVTVMASYEARAVQYCQTRSVNILTRVCRELTRLRRSKHTLVNILTIDPIQYSDYAILVWFGFH